MPLPQGQTRASSPLWQVTIRALMRFVTFRAGAFLNFDLAYPSSSIPDDFFPSDEALYGYTVGYHYH